jgi:hypothetical protein
MRVFGDHLNEVEESYLQHLRFAIWSACYLGGLAILSIMHGLIPYVFPRLPDRIFRHWYGTALPRIKRVNEILASKGLE